jgi:hypothetical protein
MVRLREVTIIKDPSLMNEKLGPFKIKKLLPLALGGMLGYGMIRKGTVEDIVVGAVVIVASLIIALGPDRALSLENQLQAMAYYYLLKPKSATQKPKKEAKPKGGLSFKLGKKGKPSKGSDAQEGNGVNG